MNLQSLFPIVTLILEYTQTPGTLKMDFLGASRGVSPLSFLIEQRVMETVSTIIMTLYKLKTLMVY